MQLIIILTSTVQGNIKMILYVSPLDLRGAKAFLRFFNSKEVAQVCGNFSYMHALPLKHILNDHALMIMDLNSPQYFFGILKIPLKFPVKVN
jgi:hypothetical protein